MMNTTNYIKSWSWMVVAMLLIVFIGYGSATADSGVTDYDRTFGQLELQMIEEYVASWE